MSNDKPCAIATIKFYANKHVEVKLTDIANVTPRSLDIASNILGKTYRGMRHAHNARMHKEARETAANAEQKTKEDEAKYHEEVDAKNLVLAKEAVKAAGNMPKPDLSPVETEETPPDAANESDGDAPLAA